MEDRYMKNNWDKYSESELNDLMKFADGYKEFITSCKTERECASYIINKAIESGFQNLDDVNSLKSGDKVYVNNRGKSVVLFIIGEENIKNGINILGAHIDSPRLDLKPHPLYEDSNLAYLDTHYYGGVKKYQWVTIPLAIHGVVVKKDGSKINVNIGEDSSDPVVGITDLLIHLAKDQMKKTASLVIEGEDLDVLVGSKSLKGEEKEAVKKNILAILKEKYDILEDDFISSELEIVPAFPARDLGLDRSMVIGYGQDDRSCSYACLESILKIDKPKKTTCVIFTDKEEIGSMGSTGMESHFFVNTIADICLLLDEKEGSYRRVLSNSKMLSCDVTAGADPLYKSASNKNNEAHLGGGLAFCKYTGSGGKSGSNDANAEYIAHLRNILDNNNITYQFTEMGKVDQGGGGTIAYILANYNVEVIDCGLPVLSMHAPCEVTSKLDLYESYKGWVVFLEEA